MTTASGTGSRAAQSAGIRSATAVGTARAMTASTPASPASVARAAPNAPALTAAVVSTGPPSAAPAGRISAS